MVQNGQYGLKIEKTWRVEVSSSKLMRSSYNHPTVQVTHTSRFYLQAAVSESSLPPPLLNLPHSVSSDTILSTSCTTAEQSHDPVTTLWPPASQSAATTTSEWPCRECRGAWMKWVLLTSPFLSSGCPSSSVSSSDEDFFKRKLKLRLWSND